MCATCNKLNLFLNKIAIRVSFLNEWRPMIFSFVFVILHLSPKVLRDPDRRLSNDHLIMQRNARRKLFPFNDNLRQCKLQGG